MANGITCVRILCSIALLFCPVFSVLFYVLYCLAGFSDMIDGTVARKTNSVSAFGAKLDTAADFLFITVCFVRLIPAMNITPWMSIWVGIIWLIKVFNVILGFVFQKRLVTVHSTPNRMVGVLLFLLVLTLPFINLTYSAAVVCTAATFAAVEEGRVIVKG